uniref:putative toxin-antitoxin system toxin component, PIN family n=1 Tax=Pedobacter schmidteae TaxID=2201271 RepID=UPI000EB241D0|nr:putative toxin-antitoxin system toxin component, PIN family [Pedobacter schmidteae]
MAGPNLFVLDTNILVSAFIIRTSVSAAVLKHCINYGVLLFSSETFIEFENTISREKFKKYFSKSERIQILNQLSLIGQFKKVYSDFKVCRDINDNIFLNLASDHNASCIVSGDKDLLILNPFQNIPILTPAQFLYYFNGVGDSFMVNESIETYGNVLSTPIII